MQNAELGVTKEKYFEICEVTGSEPVEEQIPIDFSDLLTDTQLAMNIVYKLPDRWDGASGTYQGKDLSILPYLLELHDIDNKLEIIELITTIINESIRQTNKKVTTRYKNNKYGK